NYQLPSEPVMRKAIQPTHTNQTDTTGYIEPLEDQQQENDNFQPVYASTANDSGWKDFATPAFIILSLIMLTGVIKNKG
ncbi:MAG: hypothetical protein ABI772_14075, partial [Bacteroidota bacterium]